MPEVKAPAEQADEKRKPDPLEVMDWAALASMIAFYGWLVYQIADTVHPIAAAVMGVGGCYFLILQVEERRERRKHRSDTVKFAKPPSASSDDTDNNEDDWKVT